MAKWLLLLLILSSGCSYTDSTGTRHTVVVGFGVLSMKQTNRVEVFKAQVLGVAVGNMPGANFTAGYSSSMGISTVATNALVEISQKPFSPIIVTYP